jgi:hypothetical protein
MSGHVEHHHHEHKEHHNGARINHDFERCHEDRAENVENHGDGQKRHDQIEQCMYRVTLRDGEQRRDDGNRPRKIEKCNHDTSLRH